MNSKHGKRIKTILTYGAILALGLAIGRLGMQAPQWFKSDYVEGNYQAYYPDATTKVVLYGTKTCPFCQKAREYLAQHNIAYADIDVNQPGQGQADYRGLGEKAVPVLLIGNRRITGFKQPVIEAALAQLKPQRAE
ncbi:Glutaredoxin [Duganella sacchari]|uniref:Glutaredoxin n=1 Tax=Duganella sacchari TaxID=551987 RepID=A0A1M7QZU2_9BURK|nr:glutaredoxin family protein [Duganella sacchari]SHN37898.1 Glutaredoxin [Duganella sacchari]